MTHTQPHAPATRLSFALACILSAAAATPAAAAPYVFVEVAQTEAYPEEIAPLGRAAVAGPALNAIGTVAFRRVAGDVDGLYVRSPGGLLIPVATTAGGVFRAFGRAPDVNDAGAIVFHAFPSSGGEGLYVAAPGAPLATVADTSAGTIRRFTSLRFGPGSPSLPAINNAGVVVCVVDRPNDTINTAAVLRYEGGAGGFVTEGNIPGGADVNSRGEAVFTTAASDVRVADASGDRLIATPGPVSGQGSLAWAATSNDGGLFLTGYDFGPNIVLIRDGTETRLRSGPNMNPYGGFSVNNGGEVAYLTLNGSALYAGDPTAPERLIGERDELFGSTITDLNYSREGFNDAGQVAFWASLADGRNVIALATPVPEPAAAAMLTACLALLARRMR